MQREWPTAAICPSAAGRRTNFDSRRQDSARVRRVDHQSAYAVLGKYTCRRRKPAAGIDHHTCRIRPRDAAHGQLRIVGERGADADDHGIDQSAQPVQMCEPFSAVDVMGMSAGGGDPCVDGLPELPDHDRIADRPAAQRAEDCSQGGGRKFSDSRSIRGTWAQVSVVTSSGFAAENPALGVLSEGLPLCHDIWRRITVKTPVLC